MTTTVTVTTGGRSVSVTKSSATALIQTDMLPGQTQPFYVTTGETLTIVEGEAPAATADTGGGGSTDPDKPPKANEPDA